MSTAIADSITELLKRKLAYVPEGTQRLLIADGDPSLLARLEVAFPDTPLLEWRQASWRMDSSGELLSAIIYAANEGICDFILAGGSTAFSCLEPEPDGEGREDELCDRAKLAFLERQAAQVHFADQVESLVSHPEIAPRLADASLTLRPLFYRSEADLFVAYQPESRKFEMLA